MDIIEHPGIVLAHTLDKVTVKIIRVSACGGCHAKEACTLADMEEKIIEVGNYNGKPLKSGDQVVLQMEQGSGKRAIVMGYVVPLLVLLAVLIVGSLFINDEGMLALISIASIAPYYATLYLLRDKLKKKFLISIKQ